MSVVIRKIVTVVEETLMEMGRSVDPPTRRAAAIAVIENPFAGRYVEDLSPLIAIGEPATDTEPFIALTTTDSVIMVSSLTTSLVWFDDMFRYTCKVPGTSSRVTLPQMFFRTLSVNAFWPSVSPPWS